MKDQDTWTLVIVAGVVFGGAWLYGHKRFCQAWDKGQYYMSGDLYGMSQPHSATSYPLPDYPG